MSGSGNNNDNVRRTSSGSNYRDSKEEPETKNVMKNKSGEQLEGTAQGELRKHNNRERTRRTNNKQLEGHHSDHDQ
jgi:hypothetical protein